MPAPRRAATKARAERARLGTRLLRPAAPPAGGGTDGPLPVHDAHVMVAIASGRTNLSFTAPTGSGDLLVVQVYKENTAGITPPAGFVEKSQVANASPVQQTVFYGWTADTGGGPYNFTWTGSTFAGGSIHRISGAIGTGDPFDVFDHELATVNSTSTPAAAGTTTGDNRLLLWLATAFNGTTTWTQPAGWTEIFETGNLTAARLDDPTAGATGSITGSNTDSDLKNAFLGAVRPTFTGGGGDATVTPATLAAVAALPQPLVGAAAGPAAAASVVSVIRPAANVGAGPAVAPTVVVLPQATPQSGGTTTTPATAAAVVAVARPLVNVGVGPATAAVVAVVPFGTGANTVVGPATLAAVVAVGQVTLQIGGNAVAAPATLAALVAVAQAVPRFGFTVTPATLAAVLAAPAAHPNVGVGPAVLASVASVIRPAANVGAGPLVIARAVVLPQVLPGVVTSVTPATFAAVVAAPQVGEAVGAGPAVIARAVLLPQVQGGQSIAKTPAVVAVVVAAPAAHPNVGVGPATAPLLIAFPLAVPFIPPPVPPPRWFEGDTTGTGLTEGVLVGIGIVEGGTSV